MTNLKTLMRNKRYKGKIDRLINYIDIHIKTEYHVCSFLAHLQIPPLFCALEDDGKTASCG